MAVNFQQPKGTLGHEIHLSWDNLFVHDTAGFFRLIRSLNNPK